jgi:antitoxin (DNA-binding transcriptional repressor) of toxin-antitoxin stability system
MTTLSIEKVQEKLPIFIAKLSQAEELIITKNSLPIAKLVLLPPVKSQPVFWSCRDKLIVLAEDNDHLIDL